MTFTELSQKFLTGGDEGADSSLGRPQSEFIETFTRRTASKKGLIGALLSSNTFQKDIIEIYSPGERFDSYSLVFSVGPNVVAIVLLS